MDACNTLVARHIGSANNQSTLLMLMIQTHDWGCHVDSA